MEENTKKKENRPEEPVSTAEGKNGGSIGKTTGTETSPRCPVMAECFNKDSTIPRKDPGRPGL